MLDDRMRGKLMAALFAALVPFTASASELRLMMVERTGCHWCARWNAEIGPIYPKTAEGRSAPLLRQDIHDPVPEGVSLRSPPQLTPTFILLEDGTEVSRLEGYPGDDFFWGVLGKMLAEAAPARIEASAP